MKPKVKISHEVKFIDGEFVTVYIKKCPNCHKTFETRSRNQKFCSTLCNKTYNDKLKRDRQRYESIKEVERLRTRSHSLAQAIISTLVNQGIVSNKCSVCGSIENLQVHHKDLNFFNNTPSNLELLCTECHSKVHSTLETDLHNKGMLLEEYYEDSLKPFLEVLGRTSRQRSVSLK